MENKIKNKIKKNINIEFLKIINNSALHKGHVGHNSKNDSHFEIFIKAKEFDNMGLVESHRLIKGILKEEFSLGLHSVSIKIVSRENPKDDFKDESR